MASFTALRKEFDTVLADFATSPALRRIGEGRIGLEHYKSYLRETFHYTRQNPQIQALATFHFRGRDRDVVRAFYRHAIQEVGHDQLALRDLASLGEDISTIPYENPLPSTAALKAFIVYETCYRNPVSYLGYLFFLEFLPTSSGAQYAAALKRLGVPESAMSFLGEHVRVDVAHNRMMEAYARDLIRSQSDLDAAIYALKATGRLYANMIHDAFEQADNPRCWGVAHEEKTRGLPAESDRGAAE